MTCDTLLILRSHLSGCYARIIAHRIEPEFPAEGKDIWPPFSVPSAASIGLSKRGQPSASSLTWTRGKEPSLSLSDSSLLLFLRGMKLFPPSMVVSIAAAVALVPRSARPPTNYSTSRLGPFHAQFWQGDITWKWWGLGDIGGSSEAGPKN